VSFFHTIRYRFVILIPLMLLLLSTVEGINYTIVSSDTLYGLSRQFDIPVNWIVRANGLENKTIHPGEEITIPTEGISSLEIRPGDTLSDLAREFHISTDYLRRFNNLESDHLKIGERISIPPPVSPDTYKVLTGDTLLDIAIRSRISIDELRLYNNLKDDVIHPGDLLIVKSPRPEGHRVAEGESLWTISRKYGISMDDLKSWNNLNGDILHPGKVLVLFQGVNNNVLLASIKTITKEPREELPRQGEYYFSFPVRQCQPDVNYWESPDASVTVDYRRARQVLDAFKSEIEALPKLDNVLKGWHIVIDPGHGGLDPGAIISVSDGNGNPLVITEDEYAYDVSMRLYRALHRHGASVSLTIISPDHQIRNGVDARQTFVHRKNEVYNSSSQNRLNGWRPVGTTEGLELRKTIAANQINAASNQEKQNGSLYISIHADNTKDLPEGTAVLFDGIDEGEMRRSREFAEALIPFLGKGAFTHNQPLRVLEENPADAAVLIEVRNIHYTRNAWALRSAELREQDAMKITNGILSWVD